jgi:hypothetical protein
LWYLPVLFQVLSMLSYSMFLWASPQPILEAAALISLFTLILLLRQQAILAAQGKPAAAAIGSGTEHQERSA